MPELREWRWWEIAIGRVWRHFWVCRTCEVRGFTEKSHEAHTYVCDRLSEEWDPYA